jgi:hypothetical protein
MKRPQPLADLLETCLGPAVAKQGFSSADILVSWPDIVGERLAERSQPIKVEWPRRRDAEAPAEPSTLVVRVESAFALDLQHLAPVVVERVNAFYGWRCVGRLVLKQGPVTRPAPPVETLREPGPAERARIAGSLGGIEEDELRVALERLGTAVVAAERREPDGPGGAPVPQSP